MQYFKYILQKKNKQKINIYLTVNALHLHYKSVLVGDVYRNNGCCYSYEHAVCKQKAVFVQAGSMCAIVITVLRD